MNAPVCPISQGQPKSIMPPVRLPSIPVATDLPSLIRAVNIIRDILRSITTSLTVNNTFLPGQPPNPIIYIMSPYPDWRQVNTETKAGYVYNKTTKGGVPTKDEEQRAYVWRMNMVEFRNEQRSQDASFFWRYKKELDSEFGESNNIEPFKEDFFERIVNVHWQTGLAVEFGDKAGGPPGSSDEAAPVPGDTVPGDTVPGDTVPA